MKINIDDLKKVKPISVFDVIRILKDDGIVIGQCVQGRRMFVNRCTLLGFGPDYVEKVLIDHEFNKKYSAYLNNSRLA